MAAFRAITVRVIAVVLGLSPVYAGCAARQPLGQSAPQSVKMQTELNYSEHESYAKPGENRIRGQAFLKQPGGGVVTCAESRVLLLPATSYFREMIRHLGAGREPERPQTTYPGLKNMIRKTQCDAEGHFLFEEIPDGAWFVLTQVNWVTDDGKHGGVLIREVKLSSRRTTQVLLNERNLVDR